jgi:hypothetical protein
MGSRGNGGVRLRGCNCFRRRGRWRRRVGRRGCDCGGLGHCWGQGRCMGRGWCAGGDRGSGREGRKAGESWKNGWRRHGCKGRKCRDGGGEFLPAALMGKTDQDQTHTVTWQGGDDEQDQGIAPPKARVRVGKHRGMITPHRKSGKRLEKGRPSPFSPPREQVNPEIWVYGAAKRPKTPKFSNLW